MEGRTGVPPSCPGGPSSLRKDLRAPEGCIPAAPHRPMNEDGRSDVKAPEGGSPGGTRTNEPSLPPPKPGNQQSCLQSPGRAPSWRRSRPGRRGRLRGPRAASAPTHLQAAGPGRTPGPSRRGRGLAAAQPAEPRARGGQVRRPPPPPRPLRQPASGRAALPAGITDNLEGRGGRGGRLRAEGRRRGPEARRGQLFR